MCSKGTGSFLAMCLPFSCHRKDSPTLKDLTLFHNSDAGGQKEGCPHSLGSGISLTGPLPVMVR